MAPQFLLDAPDSTPPVEPRLIALPRRLPSFDPSAGPVIRFVPLRRGVFRLAGAFATIFAAGFLVTVILLGASFLRHGVLGVLAMLAALGLAR